MFDRDTTLLVKQVLDQAREGGLKLATAESCTGGLIAASLTSVAGSSLVVERGFVTYANTAKAEMLGVPLRLIERHGAVSEQVARAMAEGGLERSHADLCLSVTGIAGPGGGSLDKPVGLVHFGCASRFGHTEHVRMEYGKRYRDHIGQAAVLTGLRLFLQMMRSGAGSTVA